ncbi:uncharacterized protein [Euphorbia lathyris]|uniref:uncharacterized protein n=1 Tax=Euphorbia lathyris TaxID=212925 RepID=UPI0033140E06
MNNLKTGSRQSLTLDDRFKPEQPHFAYADVHHEIKKNIKDISPRRLGNFLKRSEKARKEEELVKYMSNVPSYLERGETRHEKILNFGVLDWGRLEKYRNSRHSISSANSSLTSSTEGSSIDSNTDPSCSHAYQSTRRPSLQFHLISSHTDVHRKDFQKFHDVKGAKTNTTKEQGKFIRTDKIFSKKCSEIMNQYERRDMGLSNNAETGTSHGENSEAVQCLKVAKNSRDGENIKQVNKLQENKEYAVGQGVSEKCKRVTLLMPKDPTGSDHSLLFGSTTTLGREEAEAGQRNFFEMPDDVSPAVFSSDVPHSCPLPREVDECIETKWCYSDSENVNDMPNSSQSVPNRGRIRSSPSRGRISDVKKSIPIIVKPNPEEPSTGLDPKLSKGVAEKTRNTSPFRRLTIGMGKIGKTFSSKEGSAMLQLSTTHNSVKFPSENAKASTCRGSSSEMQSATSRARSSPLRRLLDPLLKPKAVNCHQYVEPLQRDAVSTDRVSKSSNRRLDSSTGARQPGIVKFDMASCTTIDFENPSREKKPGLSVFRALLRVAVKNGQPLFTFAVDNECNVLAATLKKLSGSRDDDYNCIYTFFAIQEVKKKNGRWINQGGKDKSNDYIPNIVAQLKVSGSQFSRMSRENYMAQSFAREFILFAVDLRQVDQQAQPNDELGAIVVKIPKVINRSTAIDRHCTGKCNDVPELRLSSAEEPVESTINATVILPSGVHTLPNNGGPSSLIQRWRSGGSCDCGGWDLGCKLRIFSNQNQLVRKSSASIDKFELIAEGVEEENQAVFSLAPFKDGIYSVEFTPSLSVLQAFSLCIAVLDSKKASEISESSNLSEEKTSLEAIFAQNDAIRAPNGSDADISARFVSYPPHSPVGRV